MSTVTQLVAYLEKCDTAYYVDGNPIVSNETYEGLVRSLSKIDPGNSYLAKVGTKIQGSGNKVSRIIPMGSLSKYNREEDVAKWVTSNELGDFMIAPKYDGFACELVYKDGKFVLGSTRGDGITGEDVTSAARKVVPLEVEGDLRVRGEFIIRKDNHEKLKELGYTAMRNAVPGIVRSNSDAMQYVDFVAYEFFEDANSFRPILRKKYRFFNVESYMIGGLEEAIAYREQWIDNLRESFPYEVDGLVLKTLDMRPEKDLANPQYQIAWKFKSNREATTFTDLRYQLGISGRFTPIGVFEEVEFQGAKLTSASLGNFTRLKGMTTQENPLKFGSTVEVSRRGDIIPYIEECTYTPETATHITPLMNCPHCSHEVEYKGHEPYCVNLSCSHLLQLRIQQYIGGTGIKGIGGGLVSKLVGTHIKRLGDIYRLDADIIETLPGLGQSAVNKWTTLQNFEMTKYQFVNALPFIDIGPSVWKQLLDAMSLIEVLAITEAELLPMDLKRFGEDKRKNFLAQRDVLRSDIADLLTYVNIK